MTFARFVWLLQTKSLWLARADLLSDNWEVTLTGDQLQFVLDRAPISPVGEPRGEDPRARAERIVKLWRKKIYANCWSAQEHESHALWRVFCPSPEGVAIQTTFGKLEASVGLPTLPVAYQTPGSKKQTPEIFDLATSKRQMFAYEHEVRILNIADDDAPTFPPGFGLPWDCEQNVETIWVHPEGGKSFMETVTATVATYAPSLKDRVRWSALSEQRPF